MAVNMLTVGRQPDRHVNSEPTGLADDVPLVQHFHLRYVLVGCGDPSKSRRAGAEVQQQLPSECHISR
jgi:hypothetical protein